MASRKTEKPGRPTPVPAGGAAPDRGDRASAPGAGRTPSGKNERGELRDLLGDYSEQTGAFFG